MLIGCCGTTKTYSLIREMGYDYAELSGRELMSISEEDFRKFLARYRSEAFPCRGFNDFCSGALPIVGPDCAPNALKAYTRELCRRGGQLGIRTIGIGAPAARKLPPDYPRKQADIQMADFLETASALARENGITILLEAVHQFLCDYLTRTGEAWQMVRELQLPNLALVLDYYHAMVMGEDLHGFAQIMPSVRHLHFSTDLRGHARGYPEEGDVPLLRQLFTEAREQQCRSESISLEADPGALEEHGRQGLFWMRRALHEAGGR